MVASAAESQLKSHFWITTCSCRISRMDLTGWASAAGAPPPKERAIHANHAKRRRAHQLLSSTIVEFLRFLLLTDNKRQRTITLLQTFNVLLLVRLSREKE